MHLIITIDLSGEAFQHGSIGAETARILHSSAERLATLHNNYGSLTYENPEQLYLLDSTGTMVGYVSTVEIDDINPVAQDRIAAQVASSDPCTQATNAAAVNA